MFDILYRLSAKAGTRPGTAEYVGSPRDFTPVLRHFALSASGLEEKVLTPDDPLPDLSDGRTHLLTLDGIHDSDLVRKIGSHLDLHALQVEDMLNTGHRPKAESLPDGSGLFIMLRAVGYLPDEGLVTENNVSVVLTGQTVFACHAEETPPWAPTLQRLRGGRGRLRRSGPAYLMISLLDAVVDGYFTATALLGESVAELEESLPEDLEKSTLLAIHQRRRCAIQLRNSLSPARQALTGSVFDEFEDFPQEYLPYLDDVRDHAVQAAESASGLHEFLSQLIELHISLAGLRMNAVMKLLTGIATIFIPLTFIAGVYGMNFANMPELTSPYGYPLVMLLMAVIGFGLALFFRSRRWF